MATKRSPPILAGPMKGNARTRSVVSGIGPSCSANVGRAKSAIRKLPPPSVVHAAGLFSMPPGESATSNTFSATRERRTAGASSIPRTRVRGNRAATVGKMFAIR